ncbi:PD-(D/E)XK nuclease-like domain-containing protein [Larkinella soli]|uniref:PD-(D/E)XK nuclease-like domain-containing protein n=1 Tax=Larkinella soli TaxID=1770527 RepID=UPI000FFB713B|nr:PD-(D/E)XK nuclease-like domain-containing protein [Larkinella soli]
MDDLTYRRLPAYANSDLTELLCLKTGRSLQKADPKTLQFGTIFHQLVLEPEKPVDWSGIHVKEQYALIQMQESFLKWIDPFWHSLHDREVIITETDVATKLPIKGRIDAVHKISGRIIDVKTTSCRDAQSFYNTFVEYGYDRQAAFYLDLHGISIANFLFIGIQKIKPFGLFMIDMGVSVERRLMLEEGRRKNVRLLQQALRESQNPMGWRPSSWSR